MSINDGKEDGDKLVLSNMLFDKLDRSFDSKELSRVLAESMESTGMLEEEMFDPTAAVRSIQRPPLPPGSQVFEKVFS